MGNFLVYEQVLLIFAECYLGSYVPAGKLDVHSIICALFSKLLAMWVKLLKL